MFSLKFSIVAMALALGLAIRNKWVFDRRKELNRFENGVHIIHLYADYNTMLCKFWIWDVEKFKVLNKTN